MAQYAQPLKTVHSDLVLLALQLVKHLRQLQVRNAVDDAASNQLLHELVCNKAGGQSMQFRECVHAHAVGAHNGPAGQRGYMSAVQPAMGNVVTMPTVCEGGGSGTRGFHSSADAAHTASRISTLEPEGDVAAVQLLSPQVSYSSSRSSPRENRKAIRRASSTASEVRSHEPAVEKPVQVCHTLYCASRCSASTPHCVWQPLMCADWDCMKP